MPYNGNGTFTRLYSWVADKAANINITASRTDADTNDIVSNGLGNALTRDGQGQPTANLPMNNFRHTNVANGVSRTDYAALGQVQDLTLSYAVLTGTDTYTGALVPAIVAYATGADYGVSVPNPNTIATPTINLGPGAATVVNMDGSPLVPGSLNGQHLIRFDGTNLRLLNPAKAIGVGSSTLAMSAAINEASTTITSAATLNIGAAPANYIVVLGTTTITAFDTVQSGAERVLKFSGILTLTNGPNLILPTGANITTAAGDVALFRSEGGGIWRCTNYMRASGQSLVFPQQRGQNFTANGTFTPTVSGVYEITVIGSGGGGGGNSAGGSTTGGGGGAGATAIALQTLVAGTPYAVVVGAGGAGGASGANGSNGNTSSFAGVPSTITATGGTGGIGSTSGGGISQGGVGGTATNGDINSPGGSGGPGMNLTSTGVGGLGGASFFGSGGTGNGANGLAYGSGGGGSSFGSPTSGANTGGTGANGIVIVKWIA